MASVPGAHAGGISFETSQISSAVSHRVRRRHAVYDGGQIGGNGLPRFGSLSGVLSLLFVDIDRFKAYNDTYGHQAGANTLAAVARCITDNIWRPTDSAARYGGEEFIVVLPDTSAFGASVVAEKIRSAISACQIEHAGSEYGCVTASIGTVSRKPQTHDDLTAVIKAADEAMYDAKATGRNKVSTAPA
jgi:diguanylate cyclase (GGDEF)-like protein